MIYPALFQIQMSVQSFVWASKVLSEGTANEDERKSAESVIVQLKKQTIVLDFCRGVLISNDASLKTSPVLFYTFNILKEAIVAHWTSLAVQQVHEWLELVIQFAVSNHRNAAMPNYVTQQLCSAISVIVKRSTIAGDPWGKSKLFDSIFELLRTDSRALRLLAFNLADSLIAEFGSVYNSQLQVSSQSMKLSKIEFQSKDLPSLLHTLIKQMQSIYGNLMSDVNTSELTVFAKRSFELIERILSWNFLFPNRNQLTEASEILRPGLEWKTIFLESDSVDFLIQLGSKLPYSESLYKPWLHSIMLLASLSGNIFTQKQEQVDYLSKFISFTNSQLTKNDKLCYEHPFEVASVINKLSVCFGKDIWTSLPENTMLSFFQDFNRLSVKFCQYLTTEESNNDDHVFRDAFQLLLNSWAVHLTDNNFGQFLPKVQELCFELFSFYAQCHIGEPEGLRKECDETEIEETEENDRTLFADQLNAIATVGRNCLDKTVPLVTSLMDHSVAQLFHCLTVDKNHSGIDKIFEDLHWVVLITSHLLADETLGETPTVPYEVLDLSLRAQDSVTQDASLLHNMFIDYATVVKTENIVIDPIVQIIASVFNYINLENRFLHADMPSMLSPELSSDCLVFLSRLCESYILYRNDALTIEVSTSMKTIFGQESGGGQWLVETLLSKVLLNILKYNSEANVVQETLNLLLNLVQHNREAVLKCPAMNEIIELITKHDQFWNNLSADCCQTLMQSLMIAVMKSPEMTELLLKNLLVHNFDVCVLRNNELKKSNHSAVIIRELNLILELTRGSIKACHPENTELIFEMTSKIIASFSNILSSNLYNEEIVTCQLYCLYDLTSIALPSLKAKQLECLLDVCYNYLQTFVAQGLLKIKISSKSNEDDSIFVWLETVLGIVLNIASIESIDVFGTFVSIDSAKAAFSSLNIIAPTLNNDFLKVPKISDVYFDLIATLFEFYSEKALKVMNESVYEIVFSSIDNALLYGTSSEANQALKSISSLAQYAVTMSASQNSNDHEKSVIINTCKHFIRTIFRSLINHSISNDNIEASSEALLHLITLLPNDVNEIFEAVLTNLVITDENIHEKVVAAFVNLTAPICNTNTKGSSKRTGTIFKNRLEKFLDIVGGLVIV